MTANADRDENENNTAISAPRISVIIPHLNTPDLLARCLGSIVSQKLDHGTYEVIVVDNGSRVSIDGVKAAFPDVTFLLEPVPGPGLARNRGIAIARAPALAFIDADCHAAPDWLQTAVDAVEAAPDRAVVGGQVIIETVDPSRLTPGEAFEKVFAFRQKMYIERQHFSVTANLVMSASVARQVGPFADINIVEDRETGRSRGFAFVEMTDAAEAERAIAALNAEQLQDIHVTGPNGQLVSLGTIATLVSAVLLILS